MKLELVKVLHPMIAIGFFVILFSCESKPNYQKAEQYIRQSEKDWAESVASGDSAVIVRILADDFIGVDPDGNHYTKQQMVKDTSTARVVWTDTWVLRNDKWRIVAAEDLIAPVQQKQQPN